jgi:hypothetical protein
MRPAPTPGSPPSPPLPQAGLGQDHPAGLGHGPQPSSPGRVDKPRIEQIRLALKVLSLIDPRFGLSVTNLDALSCGQGVGVVNLLGGEAKRPAGHPPVLPVLRYGEWPVGRHRKGGPCLRSHADVPFLRPQPADLFAWNSRRANASSGTCPCDPAHDRVAVYFFLALGVGSLRFGPHLLLGAGVFFGAGPPWA